MLRRDPKAKFSPAGFLFLKHRFTSGPIFADFTDAEFHRMTSLQKSPLCRNAGNRRTWWMFCDEFYWEDEGFSEQEVHALILNMLRKREKRVERAVAAMEGVQGQSCREHIPDSVRTLVWNRDGGRCVKCGSQQRLEFDHIIPVSLGGANTARNLQLLCEACNRSKGCKIG